MQGEFKQCPNGHYYQGATCPFCKTVNHAERSTSLETAIFVGDDREQTTNVGVGSSVGISGTKTTMKDDQTTVIGTTNGAPSKCNRTVFGDDEDDSPAENGQSQKKQAKYGRKLVGWLVTYSLDELGIDFKLYEGRNVIGRDMDCNISINDGRVSGKHALILFRANKYSITDSQSSHGTFVNDEDIELEPHYLKDGDIIRMGDTIFKFRSSL